MTSMAGNTSNNTIEASKLATICGQLPETTDIQLIQRKEEKMGDIIVHLDKEQAKLAHRRLLDKNDIIYIIFHDVLEKWQKEKVTTLSPVELMLSAIEFSNTILQLPENIESINGKMKDLENETEIKNDTMIIMMLASAILYAVGKHRVGFESKPVILAIYARWSDHPLFFHFLEEGARMEQARWEEGKKTRLQSYKLESLLEGNN